MNKISCGQAFSILIVIGFFNIVSSSTAYSSEHTAGLVISAILQSIMALLIITLYNKKDFNIQKMPLWSSIIFITYFIIYGGFAFSRFYIIAKSMSFPIDNKVFAIVLIAGICLYCAYCGIKAVGRSSVVIAFIFAVSLIFIFIGAKYNFDRLAFKNPAEMISYGFSDFIYSSESVILFIIFSFIKNDKAKCAYKFIVLKLISAGLISFVGTAVLGSISGISEFPFFSLSTYSQPFSVQRSDSIYIMFFAILSAVSITFFIITASTILRSTCPKLKYNEFIVTIVMLLCALIFNYIMEFAGTIWLVITLISYSGIIFLMSGGEKNESTDS